MFIDTRVLSLFRVSTQRSADTTKAIGSDLDAGPGATHQNAGA